MIIFDSWHSMPIIDPCKHQLYLSLRKERDKFLKSIRETSYCDWKIEKTLTEAGGLGRTVYILPARGGGNRWFQETFEKHLEEGRDVEPVTLRKYEAPKLSSKDIEQLRELAFDFNEWDKRREKFLDSIIQTAVKRDPKKDTIWISTARPDSYIFDHRTYGDSFFRGHLMYRNNYLGIWDDTINKSECEGCIRRCASFKCRKCEHRPMCKCSKTNPPDEENDYETQRI